MPRGYLNVMALMACTCGMAFFAASQAFAQCSPHAGNSGTNCCQPVGADVIVGEISASNAPTQNYTKETVNGVEYDAFSFGTTSCNVGSANVMWNAFPSSTHPAIAQNLYKLKNGRFEQLGLSWLKHGFTALTQNACGCTCSGAGGSVLGIGCSDPYTGNRNGCQGSCSGGGPGPRWQVNPYTGVFPTGGTANPTPNSGTTYRRLRVRTSDLEASSASVFYFAECQYVTQDDATMGNQNNNASYRSVTMTANGTEFLAAIAGTTQRTLPAIYAWKKTEAGVTATEIQIPGDGLFILAAKATDLGGGNWHYEWALENLNSDRAGSSFSVPTGSASVSATGFHDVQYHSGDATNNMTDSTVNFDGTDWTTAISGGVSWGTTQTYTENINANALRWGTLYNFRMDCNRPPHTGTITLGLFKPGTPTSVPVSTIVPGEDCNGNNVADDIDITNGTSQDLNGNGIPDECKPPPTPCPADITGNQFVNVDDLLAVINNWGPCPKPCPPYCPQDINQNCVVNVDDLLAVINAWGPCPP